MDYKWRRSLCVLMVQLNYGSNLTKEWILGSKEQILGVVEDDHLVGGSLK